MECPFCMLPAERIIASNDDAVAILDGFPVSYLHTLVISKRHVPDYFGLTANEVEACHQLLHQMRGKLLHDDPTIQGFNIGVNVGVVAGQTIPHCHIHLIPRRSGDVENPRGGVRHVIPGKGYY